MRRITVALLAVYGLIWLLFPIAYFWAWITDTTTD